eukprot:CAMPEP_0194385398 /NCGR_PEP_ID=MMETSP0174-20130528/80081_1 /TAXON_ID=216777 /ORGANISM="Proboscia alata, Strain PI-D3" /LENGTH=175 /DNA_ID=CAMNT_0039173513 /DNA_START=203 /DNA_END=730 /DNA_ORIENTATION=-
MASAWNFSGRKHSFFALRMNAADIPSNSNNEQSDRQFGLFTTSAQPSRANNKYMQQFMISTDLLISPPAATRFDKTHQQEQQQNRFGEEGEDSQSTDRKSQLHMDEQEIADIIDHADHAGEEVQHILISNSKYASDMTMMMQQQHDHVLPLSSQLDISTMKPIFEHIINAGLSSL